MQAIDVHAHFAPVARFEEMRATAPDHVPVIVHEGNDVYFRYPNGVENGPVPRAIVDIEQRLAEMDETGVTHHVLSARPQMFNYELPGDVASTLAFWSNDALVDAATSHPDRFSVLISLPLQDTDASVAAIERWASNPIVRGVMVDSNVAGRDLAEPAFGPIWAALEAHDLPILVHPYQGDVVGQERLSKHYLFNLVGNPVDTTIAIANVVFGGLVDRYPKLRWGFVHGGGVAPYLAGRWDHGWHKRAVSRELIPDALPSEILSTFWYDCIVHDTRTLVYLADCVGWDRIMLGSDCPFDMGVVDPVSFIDEIPEAVPHRDALLETNATNFLRPR